MPSRDAKLRIAWISDFPVEWNPLLKDDFTWLPKQHHASWLSVLLGELMGRPGVELHVLVLRKRFKQSLTLCREGVTFHCIKTPGGLRAPSLYWVDTFLIRSRLKKINPDVVHAWGSENGASVVATRLKVPCLVSIQGLLSWYTERVPLKAYERLNQRFEIWSLNRARFVSAESRFPVTFIKNRYPDLNVFHVEHMPDPLFHQVTRHPEKGRLLFVGTFDYRKGSDLLMNALDEIKDEFDFQLTVIGSMEKKWREKLGRNTSSAVWNRISFASERLPTEIAEALSRATLMIFPTRADTGPVAVKEAVVAGVPVVASSVGGIPDYVVPGKNGLLFPPDDHGALVRSLREALEHPLFSKGRVDEETLMEKRDYLSVRRMADGFMEAYQVVLEAGKVEQT